MIFIANESYQPKQVIFFVISEVLGVNIALLVVLEVLLALGPPTYFPRKLISALTGMMRVFSHIRIIGNNPPWWNLVLGIINLLIMVVLNFFSSSDSRGNVGPSITHLSYQKVECWRDGDDLCNLGVVIIYP